MGVVSLLNFSIPAQLKHPHKTHFLNPILSPKPSSIRLGGSLLSHKSLFPQSLPNNSNDPLFLDENGVVEDMEGYLNTLSLEYDSVWDTKPSWCQPWTITLTGLLIIAGSWMLLHSIVITVVILSLICTWWYIFLYAYPKEYSNMIAERRKMVTNGIEDTFGRSQSQ